MGIPLVTGGMHHTGLNFILTCLRTDRISLKIRDQECTNLILDNTWLNLGSSPNRPPSADAWRLSLQFYSGSFTGSCMVTRCRCLHKWVCEAPLNHGTVQYTAISCYIIKLLIRYIKACLLPVVRELSQRRDCQSSLDLIHQQSGMPWLRNDSFRNTGNFGIASWVPLRLV